jgi:peptidoglycan/LPS O-acetylase OafA/YrhL
VTERPGRFAEVDWIKAVGVLTVVLIHAVRSPFEPGASAFELWIGQWTRFAVPGFLLASGFLYATREHVPWRTTRGRLLRIAVPYLVFSLVAQILRHTQGPELWEPGSGRLWLDFAFAASLGPYYYVFIAAVLVSTAPVLARLGPRAHLGVLALELALQGVFETASQLPFFWHLRNPLLWLAWFHLGWLARLFHPALLELARRRRAALVAALALAAAGGAALLALDLPPTGRRIVEWLSIFPILGSLFFAACGRRERPGGGRLVRRLSDASYTIYLIHPFLVLPLRRWVPRAPEEFDPVALAEIWGGAVLGALALTTLARVLLGTRSRIWVGT